MADEKPIYRYRAGRSPEPRGWLIHLWWCREDSNGYWTCSPVCGRPKSFRTWPAFPPKERNELEGAQDLLSQPRDEVCDVCWKRAEGIVRRAEK